MSQLVTNMYILIKLSRRKGENNSSTNLSALSYVSFMEKTNVFDKMLRKGIISDNLHNFRF